MKKFEITRIGYRQMIIEANSEEEAIRKSKLEDFPSEYHCEYEVEEIEQGYDYEWDGVGLTITTPAGEAYIQGEDASELHDKLEELSADQLEILLAEYEHICE